MNKFSQRLAIAVMTCAAVSLTACKKEEKSEDKPAPAASTPAPTPPAATPAPTPPPAPAPEKKSEATPPPAAAPAMAPATPATPPATPAPDKKSEAPSTAPTATGSTTSATPATTQVAQATPPAAPAQPEDVKDRTSPPDPVSELAKSQGFKFDDGRYRNKDGEPQYVVTKDYMVDWATWNGFRRYHDACHVCHGPNALGSTFAPSLHDSLKTMDYGTFVATVSGGRVVNRAGTTYVMPSFGTDKNIMCYLDDIYTYIKARSSDAMPPGRPNGREDISPETRKAANDCTG